MLKPAFVNLSFTVFSKEIDPERLCSLCFFEANEITCKQGISFTRKSKV